MRISKTISTLMISGLILGASAPVAFAEDEEAKTDAQTPASIILGDDDSETKPVDPTDPGKDKPTEPEDPDNKETGNKGPLSLDVAPKRFDFGNQKAHQSQYTYEGVAHEEGNLQYLQVTDNRDADVFGWTVSVRQEAYLTNETGYALTGAYLSLPKRVSRNSLNEPTAKIDDAFYNDALNDIQLEDAEVFSPTGKNGKATSVSAWDPTDVKLTIPSNTAKKGSYTTNVLWTLSATPEK